MSDTFLGKNGLQLPPPTDKQQYLQVEVQEGCLQVLLSKLGEECTEVESMPTWMYAPGKSNNRFGYVYDEHQPPLLVSGSDVFSEETMEDKPRMLQLYEGAGGMHQGSLAMGFDIAVVTDNSTHHMWVYSENVRFFAGPVSGFLDSCESDESLRQDVGCIEAVDHCEDTQAPLELSVRDWIRAVGLFKPLSGKFAASKRLWENTRTLVETLSGLFQLGYHARCAFVGGSFVFATAVKVPFPFPPTIFPGFDHDQYPFMTCGEVVQHLRSEELK